MKLITFISAGAFIVLSACVMQKEIPVQQQQSLYDNKWNLKKLSTETGMQEVSTKAFIKFNQEKKSAGGNASCNTFGSNATINNNEVSFSNIFSTKMYCEGVQPTEDAFLRNLGKVNRFEVKGKTLLLYQNENVLLEFTVAV